MLHNVQLFELWPPPSSEPANSICKAGRTCCSAEAQKSLQESVSTNYTRNISSIVSTRMSTCLNHNFTGEKVFIFSSPPPHPPNKKREIRRLNLDKVEQLQRNSYDGIVFMSVLSTVQYISLIVHIAFTRAVRPMGIVLERSVISTQ